MFVIDSIARPLVLLDANAIRYCFGRDGFSTSDLDRLRKAMQELARLDLLRFVFTEVLAWELTAVYVDNKAVAAYEALVDFYIPLTSRWGLVNSERRKALELKLGRRLKYSEAFYGIDVAKAVAHYKDPNEIARHYTMQRGLKVEERAKEAAKRIDVVAALNAADPNWKAGLHADAETNWPRAVRSFVDLEMSSDAKQFGVKVARQSRRRPENLPTYWFQESFYAAKVRFVLVDSQKMLDSKKSLDGMPDLMDVNHFADAAYAHVLVTQDEAFLKVARLARTALKLHTFDEFACKVLAQAPVLGVT